MPTAAIATTRPATAGGRAPLRPTADPARSTHLIAEGLDCPPLLRRPTWRFSDFRVLGVLGEGAMSTVARCECLLTGAKVALKVYHRSRLTALGERQVMREVGIHRGLSHKNVARLLAAFEDADGIYLVLELAEKGKEFLHFYLMGFLFCPFILSLSIYFFFFSS
jgi:serine/threonine protein kinase